jgi:medium-chain acyl-[acyl-carrier-protein] hydrolase
MNIHHVPLKARTSEWFRIFRTNPSASIRLICFSPAGGGASFYSRWGQRWPHVEVWPLQPPGRETRIWEPLIKEMNEMADRIAAILPDDMPFAFFGHSLGAMVAWEVALRLIEQRHLPPVHLFLSACPAPGVVRTKRDRYLMPDEEILKYLADLGGTPEDVLNDREIMEIVLPIVRADFQIADTYKYQKRPRIELPATIFGGVFDKEVCANEVAAWALHLSGPLRMKIFSDGHFYTNSRERELEEEIDRDLQAALAQARAEVAR